MLWSISMADIEENKSGVGPKFKTIKNDENGEANDGKNHLAAHFAASNCLD